MHCNVCAKRLVFCSTTDIYLLKMDQNEKATANLVKCFPHQMNTGDLDDNTFIVTKLMLQYEI